MALRNDGSLVTWGRYDRLWETGDKFVSIAAGHNHALGLRTDGSLAAHGDNSSGQRNVPAGNDYTAVAGGYWSSYALKADGSIVGWGNNNRGELNVPTSKDFKAISAGRWFGVGLKNDGSLQAWGYNAFDQLNVPRGNDFSAVSAGDTSCLALSGSPQSKPAMAYFAEGCTFGPAKAPKAAKAGGAGAAATFDTYLTMANFGAEDATARVQYFCSDGTTKDEQYAVPAECRATIEVNKVVGANKEVSMLASSPDPDMAFERPMYFNYQGRLGGGSTSRGAAGPMPRWYFAEGNTLPDFDG